ncbi:MAG TPA: hypothetical protein VNS63_05525 [Blastocatellia bacterium]|nr:hypothetical protein [Blastocatellia bacterium]
MKNMMLIVVTLAFLAIGGGTTACAQVTDTIDADIPFDFMVSGKVVPAGHYTVKRVDSNPAIMELRGADARVVNVFLTNSAEVAKEPKQSELIFDRIGDQYFLSRIFEEGNRYGVEVQESRAERKLEKEGALEKQSVSIPAAEQQNSQSANQ